MDARFAAVCFCLRICCVFFRTVRWLWILLIFTEHTYVTARSVWSFGDNRRSNHRQHPWSNFCTICGRWLHLLPVAPIHALGSTISTLSPTPSSSEIPRARIFRWKQRAPCWGGRGGVHYLLSNCCDDSYVVKSSIGIAQITCALLRCRSVCNIFCFCG